MGSFTPHLVNIESLGPHWVEGFSHLITNKESALRWNIFVHHIQACCISPTDSGFHFLKNKFNFLVENTEWFSNNTKLGGQSGSANGLKPNVIFESTKGYLSYKNMVIATPTTNHTTYFDFQGWAVKVNRAMN